MKNFNFREEYIYALISIGKNIGAGLATMGLIGAGIGIGFIFSSFIFAYSKNEKFEKTGFKYVMLGFALCEAVELLSLVMAFLILYN